MIRRAALAAVIVLCALGSKAQAFVADDLQLWVDPDLTTYLWNTTDADISFDGYQIASETNGLDVAGWDSINDRIPGRLNDLIADLGAGALGFGELSPTSAQVAEGNLTGVGVLKAGVKYPLGKPFGVTGTVSDVMRENAFFVKIGGIPTQFQPHIVPEPSALLLATVAGLGLVAMRVRSKR